MDTHPDNPPLCFVKPTPDMLIKPSKYVDNNGRIYLPYLHDWKYVSRQDFDFDWNQVEVKAFVTVSYLQIHPLIYNIYL